MEVFVCFSAFFGAYKLMQVYDAKGGLTLKDVGHFYLNKYLRLAPMFYFVFFVGWALFPYMGTGPIWYSARAMYTECNDYWWAQVLFISNIYPYIQAPNYGCFFWSWIVICDMQLTLLVPIFVLAYKKGGKLGGRLLCAATIVQNITLAFFIVFKYGIRAGPLAEENWYLFAYLI